MGLKENMNRKRSDHNQQAIVSTLRNAGASVAVLSSVGAGLPDLLVGWQGRNLLVEIKNLGGRGLRFTPAERDFFNNWQGQVHVITCELEALALLDDEHEL